MLHVIAISGTVFRLGYWWWIAWYGWDDIWAAVALFFDISSLTSCLIRPTEDS